MRPTFSPSGSQLSHRPKYHRWKARQTAKEFGYPKKDLRRLMRQTRKAICQLNRDKIQ